MSGSPEAVPKGDAKQFSLTRGMAVLIASVVLIVGFVAGTRSQDIYAGVGSIFGINIETGTLDDTGLQSVYQKLLSNFDGELSDQKLLDGAIGGMVDAAGDPHTEYLSREAARDFEDALAGKVGGGVGIEISLRNNQPTVVRTLPDNPAGAAGVEAGDTIIKVNNDSVVNKSVEVVAAKIRGEAGTSVVLTVVRDGETKEFSMNRKEVNNPSVSAEIKDGIGIMTLYRFDDQTAALSQKAAQNFKQQGVDGVVIDLRNNGGGYLNAAVDVAGLWLDDKLIVTEKAGGKTIDALKSSNGAILEGIPTVVLVNEFSASASEIVAGALKDYKVATLVGQKTYGKGTVQSVIDLANGGILRVTIAHWFTPDGHGIDQTGIKPQVEVELSKQDANSGRDPQLKAAIEQLSKL